MRPSLLRDHLDVYRSCYLVALVLLVCAMAFLRSTQVRQQHMARTAQWPEVSAKVVESQIDEVGFSNEATIGSTLSVRLLLAYHVDQIPFQTELYRTWRRYDTKDYQALLAVGKNIHVRHDPSDPKTVSLASLIGSD